MAELIVQEGKTKAQIQQKAWYDRNAEYKKQKAKEYYWANREQKIAYAVAYREANYGKTIDSHLKCRYGLTQNDVAAMRSAQDDKCAICGNVFDEANKGMALHIDHCHATGRVRGLLCGKCNISLGHLEKEGFLESAIRYLGVA